MADRPQIWHAHRHPPGYASALVKSGVHPPRVHVPRTPQTMQTLPLLYLGNHWAHRAHLWYVPKHPPPSGFPWVKGVTWHVPRALLKYEKSHTYIPASTRAIVLKFGIHLDTHQLMGLRRSRLARATCARCATCTPNTKIPLAIFQQRLRF